MLENQLETTVLLRISEGVNTFYTLTKKAKVGSNEGVLSTLRRLQKKGFILKGPVGPRRVQPYHLTEDGFDVILRIVDRILDFNSFVENNRVFFPMVFNYWESLGECGLHNWVKKVLSDSVRRIDVRVWGELSIGERYRYTHDEFINDLYLSIYGPWISPVHWDTLKKEIPIGRIQDFLKINPEIIETRIQESEKIENNIRVMMENLEIYQRQILS